MDYACTVGKTTISYSLADDELRASEGGGLSCALPLRSGGVAVKRRRIYSRWFRAGVAAFIVPLITFSTIAVKEGFRGVAQLGFWGGVHVLLLLLGMFLLIRFRRSMIGVEFVRGESGICVWRDSAAADRFESFIDAVKQVIARR